MRKAFGIWSARTAPLAAALAGLTCVSPSGASVRGSDSLKVAQIVVLMRHGVRPPTKDPALPVDIAPDPWPRWPVQPGWLTPHGAEAIRMLGMADRLEFADEGVLPAAGCPAKGTVMLSADSDERTIATGDAYLEGIAPGCAIANQHLPRNAPDPLFHDPAVASVAPADADRAVAVVLGPDGMAGAERNQRAALNRINQILCGGRVGTCGVSAVESGIVAAAPGKLPKLSGALDRGSSAAQSILLEYAEGKPMSEVGWGRASAADVALVGALHSTEFAILARPRTLAAANAAGIVKAIRAGLSGGPVKLTVIIGHDTNVANVAGLLDLHWHAPGFAADDPAPGGALIFERLDDAEGHAFIRIFYRTQTLEQMRNLLPQPPDRELLHLQTCGKKICTFDEVSHVLPG